MNDINGVVILNYKSNELSINLANRIAKYDGVQYICVVDNCSGVEFAKSLFLSDKIHFIQNDKNSGYNAGNNIGLRYLIEECRCDNVFIANPDVEFGNDAIINMSSAFRNDKKLVLCSTLRYGFNREIIHQFFSFPSFKYSLENCYFIGRKIRGKYKVINQTNYIKYNLNNIVYVDAVPGAFFGMKSSFVKQIGYLYEGIFLYGEELFVGRQAYELGFKAAVINNSEYLHLHKRTPFSKSNKKMFYYDRMSLLRYYKHFKLLPFFKRFFLFINVLLGTTEYFFFSVVYTFLNVARGKQK